MINKSLKVGQPVPNFKFSATNNINAFINDYTKKTVVLYFYPKDATPGCTLQGQDLRDSYQAFKDLNVEIFGISRDSLQSHEHFKIKNNLPFELITDTDETLCNLFDVIKTKSMYGKTVRGIERSTFIINPQGVLIKEWRKVAVKGHVAEIFSYLNSL